MDSRRGSRPPQVRPRSPSAGRHTPVRPRSVGPSPVRLAQHRRVERRRGLPLGAGILLALAIAALGLATLWVASRAVGPVVDAAVRSFGSMVSSVADVVSSPAPSATAAIAAAPVIVAPDEPYTSAAAVDVTVQVPPEVVGQSGYKVRLWVTVPNGQPTDVADADVGQTSTMVIPQVPLAKGQNDIQASIDGPGGESERSAVATWIRDTQKPKLKIISPKDNATTTKNAITIKGSTQPSSTVHLRNNANGVSATVDADADGLFQARIALAAGSNAISVTTVDPAGNTNDATLTIRKGVGKLTVSLASSRYTFTASRLPKSLKLTVTVTDPNGGLLAGATALFTVTVPGLPPIVSPELTTASDGTATFSVTIPSGTMAGSGLATVLVTTTDYGQGTDRQGLTIK